MYCEKRTKGTPFYGDEKRDRSMIIMGTGEERLYWEREDR